MADAAGTGAFHLSNAGMRTFFFLALTASVTFLAPAATDTRLVAVPEAGMAAPVDLDPASPPKDLAGIHHFWIWSAELAPKSVAARDLEAALAATGDERRHETLNVRLLVENGEVLPSGSLIAAPIEMWREVPEAHLPVWRPERPGVWAIPRTSGERWRARFIGRELGSWWMEVPARRGAFSVVARSARDFRFEILDPRRAPAADVSLTVMSTPRGGRAPENLAVIAADLHGHALLRAVPDEDSATLLIEAAELAPQVLTGRLGNQPATITLAAGTTLQGRFVDGDGLPVAGIDVYVESWAAEDLPWRLSKRAKSDDGGRWRVSGLRRGAAVLRARRQGFATIERRLELDDASRTLGDLVMRPGAVMTVQVTDDEERPLADAAITVGGEIDAVTDREGRVALESLPGDRNVYLQVAAAGFVSRQVKVAAPPPSSLQVTLQRAFTVIGQFVGPDGEPMLEGRYSLVQGNRSTADRLDPGGRFRLDLPPGVASELELSSPTAREVRVVIDPGTGGEVRDLGLLRAPAGMNISGRVLRAADGMPVAGGRVWALKSSERGPLIAWMRQELVAAETDADGRFVLSGLRPRRVLLRFEGPELAPAFREVEPESGQWVMEIEPVELSAGAAVRVLVDDASEERLVTRLDLRGEGLLPDMVEAAVRDGVARFQHVPLGTVTIITLADGVPICEEEVEIASEEAVEVVCERDVLTVRGKVLVGEEPASGRLRFSTPRSGIPSGIMTFRARGGHRQQKVFATDSFDVVVEIDAEGGFSSSKLRPGPWDVVWFSSAGSSSESRRVELPDLETHYLELRYPELVIRGEVLDLDGLPVASSRVEELTGKLTAFTDADGRFELWVEHPGLRKVRARHEGLMSSVADVAVSADRRSRLVRLVLEPAEEAELDVLVVDSQQQPVAGAFVFVESDDGSSRILTSDVVGRARAAFDSPEPSRVRAAAFMHGAWSFAPWRPWKEATAGLTLEASPAGSLVVFGDGGDVVEVETAGGWVLSRLLARLGRPLRLESTGSLRIDGLPAGTYVVRAGLSQQTVSLREGESSRVDLP